MRRIAFVGVFVAVFALGGTTALANTNNDNRIGRPSPPPQRPGPGVPCQGLYMAGDFGLKTFGTPGFAHVHENDFEMCHYFNGG